MSGEPLGRLDWLNNQKRAAASLLTDSACNVLQVLAVGAGTGGSSSSSNAASLSAHRSRPFPREARWRLAMWDCIPGHNSWSSAYSVLSVLLQLQGEQRHMSMTHWSWWCLNHMHVVLQQ
jgi:hypothetical protein